MQKFTLQFPHEECNVEAFYSLDENSVIVVEAVVITEPTSGKKMKIPGSWVVSPGLNLMDAKSEIMQTLNIEPIMKNQPAPEI